MRRNKLIEEIIPTLNFKFPYEINDYCKNLYFENYHCHKDFSNPTIADSGESIENYANRCHELKAKCLFSGEHGNQGNHFHVYTVAEKEKLKYRHSTEAYWVKDRHEKDRTNCHIVLVAKNAEGRRDINYALSMANIDGYYYRPRIDLELLMNIPKDNIIVTSACIAGWGYDDASDIWLKIHEHFQDNFFFEVQTNNTDPQKRLNERILRLSEKNKIDIIAGLDSHYINDVGEVKRNQILKYKKVTYPEEQGWFMDYPDMLTGLERFANQNVLDEKLALRAFMNTNVFVNECEEIVLDRSFKIPSMYKDKTYKEKCKIYMNDLNKAYSKEKIKSKDRADGIRYEAKEVMNSGVVDYFLTSKKIVEDAINNEGGILTTTSRGSAASYITNKLIGLTTVDRFNSDIPIYPERFLTKERVDAGMMPDIDLNISDQEPFITATKKLLGEYGCMPLMAVEKLKKKAAWQLYAGANDVEPAMANQISKYIDEYEDALKYAEEDEKEFINVEDYIPEKYIDLFRKSNDYQGITINLKVHACGNLIFDGDIRREVGLITATSKTTGKRTLCACVEGGVLDDFGYVKEDFLIVDSVSLIHKCFKAIGREVPSFEELREMIKDDKSTWDIYEKGITCCVNQCEKSSTTNKVKKYKPKTLAELSAFIAAIRPGFASLLNRFLNRSEYTTGEEKIDELLNDTAHFMLYQESIMKVLSFLGMKMGDTYGVIKSISKKKLKGEKKEKLLIELKKDWENEFGNLDNFSNVWSVIEDSARYAFNSPHAYSMAGDSAYIAWFKAHHTSTFYEVAINHYQQKNKKDKINALIEESIKFYGYKLGDYKFGNDNRTVTVDEKNKLIYPNLSSVKGFGEGVVNTLYKLGLKEYSSFIDVLVALTSNSINKTIINKLIRINYFDNYGDVNTLLQTTSYFDLVNGIKQMSKEKAIKNNISFKCLEKYGHETEKQFNKIDSIGLLNELVSNIEYKELSLKEKIDNQHEILGIINFIDPEISKRIYYVSGLEVLKTVTNITLYEIYSGKTRQVKMWTNQYNKEPFDETNILYIISRDKKNQREPTGEINPKTGKKIYKDIPNKYEYWLKKFIVKESLEDDR